MIRSRGPWGGRRLAGAMMIAGLLVASCSNSTSSQGVVSTTAASTTTASTVATPSTSASPGEPTTAPAQTTAPTPTGPVKLVVGVDGDPPSLDPAGNVNSFTAGSVLLAVNDLLMGTATIGGAPEPFLLESLTEAPDRLSWTLKLRPGISFSDGAPFDADAVKFNLDRYKASLYTGPDMQPVTAIEVVDPSTVKLSLTKPYTAMPSLLDGTVGLMVSPKAVQADPGGFARNPVGLGPFLMKEWVPNDHITVVKNPNYWGEPAKVDEIEFRFVTEEAARVKALEAGDLDAMTGILDQSVETLSKDSSVQVADPPTQGYGLSIINVTRPGLDDPRVRQALDLAVDRDALAKAFGGQNYAEASFGPFPKGNPWYVPPQVVPTFDPDAARALLADYAKPVSFTYRSFSTPQSVVDSVKATVQYWNDVGIDAKLEIVPDAVALVTDIVLGNFDLAPFANPVSFDPDAMTWSYLHTGGARNFSKYSNPAMDAALDTGRESNDQATRQSAYAEVQRIFRTDLPFLISNFGRIFIAGRADLEGLDPVAFFPSRTVSVKG